MRVKVKQFYAMNQFHLFVNGDDYLQSYNSIVVVIDKDGNITLGRDWDYSTTTSKYVYMFLEQYSGLSFYGITNKRNYVRKLIEDGAITYDEEMY